MTPTAETANVATLVAVTANQNTILDGLEDVSTVIIVGNKPAKAANPTTTVIIEHVCTRCGSRS